MPSNLSPLGALPARFRRARVLVVGYGDVGARVARLLAPRVRVLGLTRSAASTGSGGALGNGSAAFMLRGDLDAPASLRRLAGVATHVLHLAPPPGSGTGDPRTAALLRALARRTPPQALVYASTSGVYGDRAGAFIDETAPVHPGTARSARRARASEPPPAPGARSSRRSRTR